MTGTQIDCHELEQLIQRMDLAPEVIQEAKYKAFSDAAPKLKALLDREIGGSGKVRSWQAQYIGSKGGYAAVRPRANTYTETNGRGKRYAVGYVTNAINSGHKFPSPSGKQGYRPRIMSSRQTVQGKQFYQNAAAKVFNIAQAAVSQVVSALIEHLEG